MIEIRFVAADGGERVVRARAGETLMRIATRNGIPGIDGECGGSCACATCHVIVDENWFAQVGEGGPVEGGLLELVPALAPTSRLSCQIKIRQDLDGLIVRLPRVGADG